MFFECLSIISVNLIRFGQKSHNRGVFLHFSIGNEWKQIICGGNMILNPNENDGTFLQLSMKQTYSFYDGAAIDKR